MKIVKEFCKRGLMFGGFGPIVLGIVCLFIDDFSGTDLFWGIVSTYALAFIQAGTSVFKDIDNWSIVKASGVQLLTIYVTYTVLYLLNSWIPFKWSVLAIFTVLFVVAYIIIWLIVASVVKATTKNMNKRLK